jgi:ubiquinone/menaquinone biosynthesis C-methylase UbiE
MFLFGRRDDPYKLLLGMTGLQLGDHFLQIGCAHGGRLAALATKVGLSGRSVAVVPDEASAARARKGAEQAGVLVDVSVGPPDRLPAEDNAFDLALVDDTGGLFASLNPPDRAATVREALRVLRPGGRIMVLGASAPSGLAALLSRGSGEPAFDPLPSLETDGFRAARTLAEREGLVFSEAIKPRTPPGAPDVRR